MKKTIYLCERCDKILAIDIKSSSEDGLTTKREMICISCYNNKK